MKILLLTDNHTTHGGAEQYFFALKSRLKTIPNLNVHSLGFGPRNDQGPDHTILKGSTSKLSKMIWRCLFNPIMYYKLRVALKKIQPDIVHLHNIKQYPLTLLRALHDYRVVQTVHDYSTICPTGQNIHQDLTPCETGLTATCFWQHQVKHNKLMYLALAYSFFKVRQALKQHVRQFLAPSPMLQDYLHRNHFQHALYIPPFIHHSRDICSHKANPNHFLFAGNLGAHKGTRLLLDEFAIALEQKPDLRLNIAGSGPDETTMRNKVAELGIADKVNFLGWQDDMRALYAQNQAVIFASIGMESFGLVITEAMSYARPVIGVNRGTAAWLIEDGQSGLLFNPNKAGDLAQKILTLACDSALASQLGATAKEKLAERFNDERTLTQILTVYKNLDHPAPRSAG